MSHVDGQPSIAAWLTAHNDLPRLELEVLLTDALAVTRAHLITHRDDPIARDVVERLRSDVERLRSGYPLAYIRGVKEFWSLDLEVNEHTLIPRPETEHAVEQTLNRLEAGDRVLDLGTGSGAIAIAIAKARPDVLMIATDISHEALAVARRNAKRHNVEVQFLQASFRAPIEVPADVVVSNPPYVNEDDPALDTLCFEPRSALASGPSGLDDLSAIITNSRATGCRALVLEHGATQAEAVQQRLLEENYRAVETHQDLAGLDRITVGSR